MPELPQPVHIAMLGTVLAVIALVLTLGQRLGEWRSKAVARVLAIIAVLLACCWIYWALLWVFKIDLLGNNAKAYWIFAAILSVVAIATWTFPVLVTRGILPRWNKKLVPTLEFSEWHSGSNRSFPNFPDGSVPTWIAVTNIQAAPAMRASNVTARLEFIDSAGKVRFTVPQATWFFMEGTPGSRTVTQLRPDVYIEGGDEQSFVMYARTQKGNNVVYKNGMEPIGQLDYDKWRVRIIVESDDAFGFQGEIGFTYTINGLIPDHPAFTKPRPLKPLVRQGKRSQRLTTHAN